MKITIVGIGGVGGYIGGKLSKANNKDEIIFIARGKQLETIKEKGLKVLDEDKEFTIKPQITTDNPEHLGVFDLIIIATKSYDLKGALTLLKNNISNNTVLLPLLNGVDHDKEIKKIYPNAKVLNGCIYILSNIKELGVVKKYGGVFNLMFGSEKDLPSYEWIKELFDKAELKNKLTEKIEFEVWRKFLLISAYASICSYYKEPIGYIVKHKMDELEKVLNEIKAVANKKGIGLSEKNVTQVLNRAKSLPYESKMSMQLDFEKGKKTELDALCGYIVKEGEKLGVDTPLMKKMYDRLR